MNNFGILGMSSRNLTNREIMDEYGRDIANHVIDNPVPAQPVMEPLPNQPSIMDNELGLLNTDMLLGREQAPLSNDQLMDRHGEQAAQFITENDPESLVRNPIEQPVEQVIEQPSEQPNERQLRVEQRVLERFLAQEPSEERQQQAIERFERRNGVNWGALLAGFGTALQGRGGEGATQLMDRQRQEEIYRNDNDPSSTRSKMARRFMEMRGITDLPEDFTYQMMLDFNPSLAQAFNEAQARFNQQQQAADRQRQAMMAEREFQREAEGLSTPVGIAIDEQSAAEIRNNEAALESIMGNIGEYRTALNSGSRAERAQARTYLRAEVEDAVNNGLLPSGAIDEFDRLVPAGLTTFNSTTSAALDRFEERMRGNFTTNARRLTRSTARENLERPRSVRQASETGRIVRFRDPETNNVYSIPVGTREYDEAIRRGFQNAE